MAPPCTLLAPLPPAKPLSQPACHPLRLCLPLDSAEHASVQPVAEFQHFQRHKHRLHVSGAAPRMPLCPLSNWPYKPTACAAVYPTPFPPARMSPSWYASLLTRQSATAFNQPLSLDTSKVTTVNGMFYVRPRKPCARSRWALPLHVACAAVAPPPSPFCWASPRFVWYASLSTRQRASAFNQPLSLDTSSVTDMSEMFEVRSKHALYRPTPSFSAHMPPFSHDLLSTRRRRRRHSTSRCTSTRPAFLKWWICSMCVPRMR